MGREQTNLEKEKVMKDIQPLSDYVLVELDAPKETNINGIIVPEVAQEKTACRLATVVAVGPLCELSKGDKIVANFYESGYEVEENIVMVREKSILASVTE